MVEQLLDRSMVLVIEAPINDADAYILLLHPPEITLLFANHPI
jgi:hypothetical protein